MRYVATGFVIVKEVANRISNLGQYSSLMLLFSTQHAPGQVTHTGHAHAIHS